MTALDAVSCCDSNPKATKAAVDEKAKVWHAIPTLLFLHDALSLHCLLLFYDLNEPYRHLLLCPS